MSERVFKMSVASVYPHYVTKVEKKGYTAAEVDTIIHWLTGYTETQLAEILAQKVSFRDFFENAPQIHPNVSLIKGLICGHRVEDIKDPLMQQIRFLDKLIDELARGKAMDKVLRK